MPPTDQEETLQPVAGALAVLFPGLGHVSLGEARRGVLIMVGVLGLFFGGLLIGGIDVVDRKEDFWWFVGQAGVGPVAFAVDWAHQSRFKVEDNRGGRRSALPDENPPNTKSLGHVNEIGALYAAVAGMLNLICVIDAVWHTPRRRAREGGAPKVVGSLSGGGR